jgi:hypothetical protein
LKKRHKKKDITVSYRWYCFFVSGEVDYLMEVVGRGLLVGLVCLNIDFDKWIDGYSYCYNKVIVPNTQVYFTQVSVFSHISTFFKKSNTWLLFIGKVNQSLNEFVLKYTQKKI